MEEENLESEVMNEEETLEDLHKEALEAFIKAYSPVADEREQCLEDRRFYSIAGAQWEGALGDQFENKPQFEVNKIHLSVMRIINDYRNNRISVDFTSDSNDAIADTCDKLYRADEQDSIADEAYDNAFEEGVGGGFAAWRLSPDYEDHEDDENDYQRIKILPIYDGDSSVFFDPNAKRQDKKDARYCFVLTAMHKEAFEEEWGDISEAAGGSEYGSSMDKVITQAEFDWAPDESVYIAEYFKVEFVKTVINIFENSISGETKRVPADEIKEDPTIMEELLSTGFKLVGTKKVKKQKVRKYIIDGARVLEDCGYLPGKYIPIVPFYGKRWFVDNIERCMGHVRLTKDAQRLKNMQLSKLAEIAASSSIEKPIFTPEQIAGHENLWKDDNINNYPYMLINPITDAMGNEQAAGAIGYTKPPAIAPAMAALLQLTDQDIRDLLGNQEQGEKMLSNIGAETVDLIHQKLDMQTFIYMSNMAKSMRRSGEIWLSMAKELYIEDNRKMKGVTTEQSVEYLDISKATMNKDTGEVEYLNDISKAKLDVKVNVAPSTSSSRRATVNAIANISPLVQDPETQQVLGLTAIMNMEGEGVEDIRAFTRRKLIKMGAVKPTEKEAQDLMQEMQGMQPSTQDLYLQAEAQKSQAQAVESQAKTAKALADAEATKAKTVETLAKIQRENQSSAINSAKVLNDLIESGQARYKPGMEPQGNMPQQGEF